MSTHRGYRFVLPIACMLSLWAWLVFLSWAVPTTLKAVRP